MSRKLTVEIEKTLKKVTEGVEVFESKMFDLPGLIDGLIVDWDWDCEDAKQHTLLQVSTLL